MSRSTPAMTVPAVATGLYDLDLPVVFDVYWRAIARSYSRRRTQYRIKRGIDIALALVLLIVLTPLLLLVAVAVRASGTGPVLYRQQRLMRGGWEFTLLKFRTMVAGADSMIIRAYSDPVTGTLFKSMAHRKDPRVTAVGRVLRATYLDELPQLINVLRGEMSFVGPRPCQLHEAEAVPREFIVRFAVPQGLTGPWQTQRHRHQQTFTEQLRIEAAYVDRWSLLYDLGILLKTIPAVITRTGV